MLAISLKKILDMLKKDFVYLGLDKKKTKNYELVLTNLSKL